MTKKSLFVLIALVASIAVQSQDLITLKNGTDIQAKITEVGTTEIRYKKFDNVDGPVFIINKAEVLMVRHENGAKDIFNEPLAQNTNNTGSGNRFSDSFVKGKGDAEQYYRGRNSGAIWSGAATAIFSPLLGWIPSLACATYEPKDENLNYPDYNLMQDMDYRKAYIERSHKTKKRKIWTSYGVGSGVWLVLILL